MAGYNLKSLCARLAEGESPEYLFFWGHHPAASGELGASCLSQWYAASFAVGAITYATAEHYMMASKARTFNDDATLAAILASDDPDEAKALGRKVKDFNADAWRLVASDIVVVGNLAKFSQNEPLGHWLRATSPKILVEASPVDKIWGTGLAQDHPDAGNPLSWPGKNRLGFALMEVRDRLVRQLS
jgi:ribA/ribD-fused uncharacterized protein